MSDTRKLLLKAADIAALEGERKVHFINANAVRVNKSLGDAVGLEHIGVHIFEVQPGHDTTEYHLHWYEEECIYCLSGRGTLEIEGDRYPFAPGDFVGLPRKTAAHGLVNDGDEPLVGLVMGQRLAQDESDHPKARKRLYRNSGSWDLVDLDAIENLK